MRRAGSVQVGRAGRVVVGCVGNVYENHQGEAARPDKGKGRVNVFYCRATSSQNKPEPPVCIIKNT